MDTLVVSIIVLACANIMRRIIKFYNTPIIAYLVASSDAGSATSLRQRSPTTISSASSSSILLVEK